MITRNPVLIIGIVGTLVATAATILLLARPSADPTPGRTSESRVTAAADIPAGTRLGLEDLHGSSGGSNLTSAEAAIAGRIAGKQAIKDIPRGTQIRETDVEPIREPTTWRSIVIPRGLRGLHVQMPVGMEGQPDLVQTGDHVDILGIGNSGGGPGESHVVAQDVPVLARFEPAVAAEASSSQAAGKSTTLMLAVTHEQAIRISEAEVRGRIRLLVRNPMDRTVFAQTSKEPAGNSKVKIQSNQREPEPGQALRAPAVSIIPPAAAQSDAARPATAEIRVIRGTQAEWIPVPLLGRTAK